MTIKNLVDALPSIRKVATQDLHAKTLYRVSRLLDRFEGELKSYDETRDKLVEKYCIRHENGGIVPKIGCREAFETEMEELLGTELEEARAVRIPAEEDIRISYADLRALRGFVEIEFDETEEEDV